MNRFLTERNNKMKYKAIDLFAGIGGIRKGFDNAFGKNIETVFVSEWDEYAQKTYRANYKINFRLQETLRRLMKRIYLNLIYV